MMTIQQKKRLLGITSKRKRIRKKQIKRAERILSALEDRIDSVDFLDLWLTINPSHAYIVEEWLKWYCLRSPMRQVFYNSTWKSKTNLPYPTRYMPINEA